MRALRLRFLALSLAVRRTERLRFVFFGRLRKMNIVVACRPPSAPARGRTADDPFPVAGRDPGYRAQTPVVVLQVPEPHMSAHQVSLVHAVKHRPAGAVAPVSTVTFVPNRASE